ncbi:unnamed protein product [Paramecium octaurelia]|uniref:Uncharacterized protein n=1 Tax=Paramecium octaurelia TaxID=43137 RepID=A0A8S1TYC8_PAROT|nr:unnamed protein product [Paramecium octaurelia]
MNACQILLYFQVIFSFHQAYNSFDGISKKYPQLLAQTKSSKNLIKLIQITVSLKQYISTQLFTFKPYQFRKYKVLWQTQMNYQFCQLNKILLKQNKECKLSVYKRPS